MTNGHDFGTLLHVQVFAEGDEDEDDDDSTVHDDDKPAPTTKLRGKKVCVPGVNMSSVVT